MYQPSTYARIERVAERDPRRAVPLARRALASTPDGDNVWPWAAFTLGWALLCWERFDEARTHLRIAEARFTVQGNDYGALRCRHGLLLAEQLQFARPDIGSKFAELATQFTDVGDESSAIYARLYQAVVFNVQGRAQDAQHILNQIESIIQSNSLNKVRFLRIQGVVALLNGDSSYAALMLHQSEQLAEKLKSPYEVARSWFEQGWLALRQEQIDVAIGLYKRAEAVFIAIDLPLRRAFCAKGISFAQSRRGEYDVALASILTALNLFRLFGRTNDIAGCDLNLGNIYFHTGRWVASLACYSRAEQLYASVGIIDEQLFAKHNIAAIYRVQQRHNEAFEVLDEIEKQAQALHSKATLAEAYSLRAGIFADIDDLEAALQISEYAYKLFIEIENLPGAADCLFERGWLLIRRQQFQSARELFQQAAQDLRQHSHIYWRVEYGLARCAEAQGAYQEALERYRRAALIVGGLRRRLLSEELSSGIYTQAEQLVRDGVRLAAAHNDAKTVLLLHESQRALVLQRMLVERPPSPQEQIGEDYQALHQQISALLPTKATPGDPAALDAALAAYGDLLVRTRHSSVLVDMSTVAPPATAFDLEEVRSILSQSYGSDWTALSYTFERDRLLITSITSDNLVLEATPIDAALTTLLEQATLPKNRRRIYLDLPFQMGFTNIRWKILGDLAQRLLPASVRARLHPDHRLYIVPSEALHSLPWAALRLHDSWLVEQAVLHVVPALAAVQVLGLRSTPGHDNALLLGCGDFGARDTPLPGVERELGCLGELHGARTTTVYPATCTDLIERSANGDLLRYGRIHIATHGKLLGQQGLAAHLKFADGDLLLPEVAALRLAGPLVVLSACDGAAADVLPGDEVWSLSWALLAAGACGVLASQWPVFDVAVIQFMIDFYTALNQYSDPAHALALTQRTHIHTFTDPTDQRGLPFCWGSFVLTGGVG